MRKRISALSYYVKSQELHDAAYYKWLNRTPSAREIENEEIIKEMKVLHEKVDGIYGYRRMTLNMNRKFGQEI